MKTALVIEDDENNMVLISALLERGGYRVIQSWTGVEGATTAIAQRPDFIILDIRLPDIDGFEVLRRIRGSEADGGIPIIAMTSYAMSGDRERLLNAGCTGFVEKPIDPAKVLDTIGAIVGEDP